MSDPVSSMDVEDVLSSIRRLVSEEARTDKGDTRANDTTAATQEEGLTPSTGQRNQPSDLPPPDEDGIDEGSTEAASANDERASAAPGQPPAGGAPRHVSFRHQAAAARRGRDEKLVLTSAFRVTEPPVSQPGPIGEPRPEPPISGQSAPQRPSLHTGHPHLRPVDGSQPSLREPERDDDDNDMARASAFGGGDEHSGPETDGGAQPRPFHYAPEDTLFARAQKAMEAVRGKDEKGQTASLTGDADTPETDSRVTYGGDVHDPGQPDPDSPSHSGPTDDSTSDARSNAPEQRQHVEDTEDEVSTINFAEEEETILDEEMLRDLVSEMVREELQGELGDRITRNVRKLVRREIQRALASREFE